MAVPVVDGVVHGDVPLEGDGDGHEDGGRHGDAEPGVEEVGEEVDVDHGGRVEALADGLRDRADQVAGIHKEERDQQEVERVAHVLPENESVYCLSFRASLK